MGWGWSSRWRRPTATVSGGPGGPIGAEGRQPEGAHTLSPRTPRPPSNRARMNTPGRIYTALPIIPWDRRATKEKVTKSADFGRSACGARPQGLRNRFSAFPAVRMTRAQHTRRGEQQESTLQALTSAITGPVQILHQVTCAIYTQNRHTFSFACRRARRSSLLHAAALFSFAVRLHGAHARERDLVVSDARRRPRLCASRHVVVRVGAVRVPPASISRDVILQRHPRPRAARNAS